MTDAGRTPPALAAVIDAHQHFWNLAEVAYPWLNAGHGPLFRTFTPEDLEPTLRAHDVRATVLVQAANSLADTDAMLRIAEQHAFVRAVVGWMPLLDPPATKEAIRRYGAHPRFRGVRHLIHDEPDPDWLMQPLVQESLGLLAEADLSFDVVAVLPRHLEHVVTIAARLPQLRLVIDHLAKPPIRAGQFEPWASLMERCASFPSVYAKVSGLNTAADWTHWSAADLSPYIEHARRCFGATRLMFGSDWPVAILAGDFARVLNETSTATAHWSETERRALFGGTAVRFYRLDA